MYNRYLYLIFCLTLVCILLNSVVYLKKQKTTVMSTIEFQTKFNQMSQVLQSFAYNLTKNGEEAKDLFQETAYRALTNRDKFRPGTNFKAWLFTIMKNIFINNYRKRVKANTIFDSTDNDYYINSGSTVVRNGSESQIMMKELWRMINELDESIRIPFVMHYEGYKYQEIADEMGISLKTVEAQMSKALRILRENLSEFMPLLLLLIEISSRQ